MINCETMGRGNAPLEIMGIECCCEMAGRT